MNSEFNALEVVTATVDVWPNDSDTFNDNRGL